MIETIILSASAVLAGVAFVAQHARLKEVHKHLLDRRNDERQLNELRAIRTLCIESASNQSLEKLWVYLGGSPNPLHDDNPIVKEAKDTLNYRGSMARQCETAIRSFKKMSDEDFARQAHRYIGTDFEPLRTYINERMATIKSRSLKNPNRSAAMKAAWAKRKADALATPSKRGRGRPRKNEAAVKIEEKSFKVTQLGKGEII